MKSAVHELELKISYLLRYGVLLAGLFLFVGWMITLISHGDVLGNFTVYKEVGAWAVLRDALAAHDYGLLISYFGLALLVMLPVVRVVLTGVLFIHEGDYILGTIALVVFVVLVASFALGIDL